MTPIQIETKIAELGLWLIHNPNHPDYQTVLKDRKNLEQQRTTEND